MRTDFACLPLVLGLVLGTIALMPGRALAHGEFIAPYEAYIAQAPPSIGTASALGFAGTAVDLNGDGRDEFVTGWWDEPADESYVQIRSFGASPAVPSTVVVYEVAEGTGEIPGKVEPADLNGDGILDLVVPLSQKILLLPGTAPGVFGAPIEFPVVDGQTVAVGDFDRDGIQDLAVAFFNSHTVRIYHGTGDFGFVQTGVFNTHRFPSALGCTDVDGNGFTDLVVSADTTSTVLVGDGAGHFTPFEVTLAGRVYPAGDLNGDGRGDLVSLSAAYLSNGDGSFQAGIPFPKLNAVGTGDIDGDGRLDLIGAPSGTSLLVGIQHGNGDGTFGPASLVPYRGGGNGRVITGDFDGDGHKDIAVASTGGDDGVQFGLGNGLFPAARSIPLTSRAGFIAAGNFGSGPRKDLLVVAAVPTSMTVLHQTGLATWSAQDSLVLPGNVAAYGPEIADLNGDGRDDVVLAYDNLAQISVWLTLPSGQLGARLDLPTIGTQPNRTTEVAVGDIDGDGRLDIAYEAIPSSGSLPLNWYRGLGDGTFNYVGTLSAKGSANVEIRDLNGDGRSDIVSIGNLDNVEAVLATGPAAFGAPVDYPKGSPTVSTRFVMGRFNDDPYADIMQWNGLAWGFLGAGNGTFGTTYGLPRQVAIGQNSTAVDLDGDGRDEIVSGSEVVHFNPDGTFASATLYGTTSIGAANPAAVVDADGNGRPDLVTTTTGPQLMLLINSTGPQVLGVRPPSVPAAGLALAPLANPVGDQLALRISTGMAGNVSVELLDLQGRRLRRSVARADAAGTSSLSLGSTASLSPGLYLVRARQGNQQVVARVSILH